MTREPYSWSFPNEGNPDPNAPGRLPRRTWTPQERRTYEASVQWFHQAKYGIFFHFLSEFSSPDGSPWKPETWTKWVDFLVEYTKDYRVNFTKALKHGNPEAIVASGTLELSDYLHGHCMPDWNRQSKVASLSSAAGTQTSTSSGTCSSISAPLGLSRAATRRPKSWSSTPRMWSRVAA
jgi:hypothetical protein